MASEEFAIAQRFLQEEGWPTVVARPDQILQTLFAAESIQYNCYLHVFDKQRQLVFYSVFPRQPGREHVPALLEFTARANWDLHLGNFELQVDSGSLRFKTSLTLGEAQLEPALLRPLTFGNVTAMWRFHSGIDALLERGATATEALALAI